MLFGATGDLAKRKELIVEIQKLTRLDDSALRAQLATLTAKFVDALVTLLLSGCGPSRTVRKRSGRASPQRRRKEP